MSFGFAFERCKRALKHGNSGVFWRGWRECLV